METVRYALACAADVLILKANVENRQLNQIPSSTSLYLLGAILRLFFGDSKSNFLCGRSLKDREGVLYPVGGE